MSETPHYALIAGSGMSRAGHLLDNAAAVPFDDIPGVGACTVAGHRGEVRTGTLGGTACTIVLGRRHFYEGDAGAVDALVGHLARTGVTDLVVCSAAGGLDRSLPAGHLVIVTDIIDLQNRPGMAVSTPAQHRAPGARMTIDDALRRRLEAAATAAGVNWCRGTMACGAGPTYETPAEVRFLQGIGADLVTMSAAPEVASANRHALRVASIGAITNPGTGIAGSVPDHEEVLQVAEAVGDDIGQILLQLVAHE